MDESLAVKEMLLELLDCLSPLSLWLSWFPFPLPPLLLLFLWMVSTVVLKVLARPRPVVAFGFEYVLAKVNILLGSSVGSHAFNCRLFR